MFKRREFKPSMYLTTDRLDGLGAEVDADTDVATFRWFVIDDQPGPDPKLSAGALIVIKGDAQARELAAWLEAKGWITFASDMASPPAPAHAPGDADAPE